MSRDDVVLVGGVAHAGDRRPSPALELDQLLDECQGALDAARGGILDASTGRRWSLTARELLDRASVRREHPRPEGKGGGGAYGNPVLSEVTAKLDGDATDADLLAWRAFLVQLQLMRDVGRQLLKPLDQRTPTERRPERLKVACRVCGAEEIYQNSERCQWDYRFWLTWGVDTPWSITKLRRQGRRVTENLVRAALDEELAG